MNNRLLHFQLTICRANHERLQQWMCGSFRKSLLFCLPTIILGCAAYGFSMGIWHGWEMGLYVAIKLPLLLLGTLALNALINGLLAQVLDSGISMRQSMQFLLTAFAIMACILGAMSPIMTALAWQSESASSAAAGRTHIVLMLTHVLIIAYAGCTSHYCLHRFLRRHCTTAASGTTTFFAWILGNLFVGAQLSWVLRPFYGSPRLEISFLREDALHGNFYESVFDAIQYYFF